MSMINTLKNKIKILESRNQMKKNKHLPHEQRLTIMAEKKMTAEEFMARKSQFNGFK